jgi:hypothetical protein
MDRVHGFGSWVNGILVHSRSLILWSTARIFLKQKRIGNLILALHLRADDSHRSSAVAPWGGLTEASLLSSLGHVDAGFLGQNDAGLNGVLTQDETRRGTTTRWFAVAAPDLRAWTTVSGGSGALLASTSSSTPFSWPPLASPDDRLAWAAVGQWCMAHG